jgi:hypothetical protein
VIVAAGAAALILLALLVYAVIHMSDSSKTPESVPFAVVCHVVDVHDVVEVDHQLFGAESANQPG